MTVGTDSGPTGVVFNTLGSGFNVTNGTQSGSSRFIFDGEDGVLRGWNPAVDGTHALVGAMGDPGAIFKGLAIADGKLFASDFHNNEVAVFDSNWNLVDRFTDTGLPSGYAPFGIQAIGGHVFVTFAKQDADAEDEVAGQGRGFVDEFDTSGNLVARVAQHGQLNAPWGLAQAPSDFGRFSGDLLVGNFGDGQINAYALGANGHVHAQGRAARERAPDLDRRALGARVRQQRQRGAHERALLHRGAERRVARPLRKNNRVGESCAQKAGDVALDGLVSRFSD